VEVSLSLHLTLLCHAATQAMREGAFPGQVDPVDDGGLAKARAQRIEACACVSSPALAARQTAEALGMAAATDIALRDIDHGEWAGRAFGDIHLASPDAFADWMADPASGAPGGETLVTVRDRMAGWLSDRISQGETMLAITHPMVIRAAIAAAIDITPEATLRIDIAPLCAVRLSWNRVWRLQSITA
jgi:broad specificity phosphatase PhoE